MLKIWLIDPIHDQVNRVGCIPLGIGCLASALEAKFPQRIETKLFTYPENFFKALDQDLPDVVAVSNYIWNSRLSLRLLRYAKEKKPSIITIMGGPHARIDDKGLGAYIHCFADQ